MTNLSAPYLVGSSRSIFEQAKNCLLRLGQQILPAHRKTMNKPQSGRISQVVRRAPGVALFVAVMSLGVQGKANAQEATKASPDSLATLRITVLKDSTPLAGAIVRVLYLAIPTEGRASAAGLVTLRVPAGEHIVTSTRLGFRPDTLRLTLRAQQDTSLVVQLTAHNAELESIVVSATRGERRVEDSPLRVEVIDEEEIAEKVTMTPGDIAMMLNETSGLRVQMTNPSLGGANVRMLGLDGRYSLILADGLPLYGGQAGGLGLLQIPPVDLGRVEVIKGAASALYGSSALGGIINLVSRLPHDEREHTALVNQTSRKGTDAVYFGSGPISRRWGYTFLGGAHRQGQSDRDRDGWTDLPGYKRVIFRPRFYFDNKDGQTAFLTAGATGEQRTGGTLNGRTVPGPGIFQEALDTKRFDMGGLTRWVLGDSSALTGLNNSIFTLRGSAVQQGHLHQFGRVSENDRHRTSFGEAALTMPRSYGAKETMRATYVAGVAFQQDAYQNTSVPGFDYIFNIPAAFAQLDLDPATWLSLSTSARLDAHSEYGTFVNPRVSLLLRRPPDGKFAGWTTRLSGGTGAFAPTPFTDETETTGLTPLAQLVGLTAERARSASLDVGGPLETSLGQLQINGSAFGSRVASPIQVQDRSGQTIGGARRIALANASGPTRTWGGELLARLVHELGDEEGSPSLRATATYTYLRATECNPDSIALAECSRQEVPLTPRHAAGTVVSIEQEGKSRVGIEVYYTGKQTLEDNPYRSISRPYVLAGLLGERAFETRAGVARVFVNFENLTNVRQTRFDPLLLPARGQGGRWSADAWTDLAGFTVNGGVRLTF